MRTETTTRTLYTWDELNEEAKEKALEKLYDINVRFDWWENTYTDAQEIGLKLTGFDICRGNYCNGEFILSACEVAQNIFNHHGDKCETYKTATDFMQEWQPVFDAYMDETSPDYESYESEGRLQELEAGFLKSLLEDYLVILRKEFEYLTSEEAIIEAIQANEYEFDDAGHLA